jgi:hypothetical protein
MMIVIHNKNNKFKLVMLRIKGVDAQAVQVILVMIWLITYGDLPGCMLLVVIVRCFMAIDMGSLMGMWVWLSGYLARSRAGLRLPGGVWCPFRFAPVVK